MKTIIPHDSKPDWFILYDEAGIMRAAGSMEHCKGYATKRETFPDGSEIITDETTGNRTVIGNLAHDEYFKRLRAEQITANTPYAIIEFCSNPDGTRKAELIRKIRTNPISIETFGKYAWEVWTCNDKDNVVLCRDEASARQRFQSAMINGTNGFGVPPGFYSESQTALSANDYSNAGLS